MDEFCIPGLILMENAGRVLADVAVQLLRDQALSGAVTVFCGAGNNGGDGLVAARYLFNIGCPVRVVLVKPGDHFKGDAQTNFSIIRAMGMPITVFDEGALSADTAMVIDALLGTGLQGEVAGIYRLAIERINEAGSPVISADIPSGLDGDTGKPMGDAVHATTTVTMGFVKTGMTLEKARPYIGEIVLADIGLPRQLQ
jgi:NAD(P)H-hydrate epimerase